MASVIRILDGAAFPFPCLNWDRPVRCAECPGPGACPAHAALGAMGNAAHRVLQRTTLADLVREVGSPAADTTATLLTLRRASGTTAREIP